MEDSDAESRTPSVRGGADAPRAFTTQRDQALRGVGRGRARRPHSAAESTPVVGRGVGDCVWGERLAKLYRAPRNLTYKRSYQGDVLRMSTRLHSHCCIWHKVPTKATGQPMQAGPCRTTRHTSLGRRRGAANVRCGTKIGLQAQIGIWTKTQEAAGPIVLTPFPLWRGTVTR